MSAVGTDQLTLPGFHHDVYSAAHPLFVAGPAFAELGDELAARGLAYANTDTPTGVSFPDGRTGVLFQSMDANGRRGGPARAGRWRGVHRTGGVVRPVR